MNIVLAVACASIVAAGCEKRTPESVPVAAKPTTTVAPTVPASSSPTPAPASAPVAPAHGSSAIVLVPKVSFGPINLGATRTHIEAMGILKTHPQYSGMTIPYTVYYDAGGKAKRIELSLMYAPGDVTVGNVMIPRTATMDEVKKLLGDCADEPPATGGTTSKCRGGTVNVSVGSGNSAEVWLNAALS